MRKLEECPRWKTIAKTLGCAHACCTPGSEVQIGSEATRSEQGAGRWIGDDVGGWGIESVGLMSNCRVFVFPSERAGKTIRRFQTETLADV